jgi:hypothetical protein
MNLVKGSWTMVITWGRILSPGVCAASTELNSLVYIGAYTINALCISVDISVSAPYGDPMDIVIWVEAGR